MFLRHMWYSIILGVASCRSYGLTRVLHIYGSSDSNFIGLEQLIMNICKGAYGMQY